MRVSAMHYELMAESGCEEISFGIESGDQGVLNILNKGITVRQSIKAVQEAKKGGIPFIRALLMMGTPGETFSTLSENIEWVEKARPDMVSLKMFVPYPDTKVYNDPEKYGCELLDVIDTNNSVYRPDGSSAKANIKTNNMTNIELTAQFHKMREFLERKCLENRG